MDDDKSKRKGCYELIEDCAARHGWNLIIYYRRDAHNMEVTLREKVGSGKQKSEARTQTLKTGCDVSLSREEADQAMLRNVMLGISRLNGGQ